MSQNRIFWLLVHKKRPFDRLRDRLNLNCNTSGAVPELVEGRTLRTFNFPLTTQVNKLSISINLNLFVDQIPAYAQST
jgi:hypothetical protein